VSRGDFCPSLASSDLSRLSQSLLVGYNQPGYRATLPANTTIGTFRRFLNLKQCGQRLNRETGFDPVSLANKPPDNLVEGSQDESPASQGPYGLGLAVPTKRLPARGKGTIMQGFSRISRTVRLSSPWIHPGASRRVLVRLPLKEDDPTLL